VAWGGESNLVRVSFKKKGSHPDLDQTKGDEESEDSRVQGEEGGGETKGESDAVRLKGDACREGSCPRGSRGKAQTSVWHVGGAVEPGGLEGHWVRKVPGRRVKRV